MKKILAIAVIAALSGCATTNSLLGQRMSYQDLNTFQIDCTKKYEQIAFLQAQMPTQNQRFAALFTMSPLLTELPAHFRGEVTENRRLVDGDYGFVIRSLISSLERHCPDSQSRYGR